MIIQIRGTSGSGKSWVMREVMKLLTRVAAVHAPKRKQPLYYVYELPGVKPSPTVAVCGHYESPCGGGDTIGSARQCYDLIKDLAARHDFVLCEGLLLSEDTKWTHQLQHEVGDVRCIFLATPIDTCITQIKQRRAAVGNEKTLNETNTRNRVEVIERARNKLALVGIRCRSCSSGQAVGVIEHFLFRKEK